MNKTTLKKEIQNLKRKFFKRNFYELENFNQENLRSSYKLIIVIEIFKLLHKEKTRIHLDRNNLNELYERERERERERELYNLIIYKRLRDIKYFNVKKFYNNHEK